METISMSAKERRRLEVLARVREKHLKLVEAATLMRLSYRQAKRVWRRFRLQGDAGLVHRSRGRPSGRGLPKARRQRVLEIYQQDYPDFGPTLAAEHLERRGQKLNHETLRRWLIQAGLWREPRCGPVSHVARDNRVTALARYATHAAGSRDNATHVEETEEAGAASAVARAQATAGGDGADGLARLRRVKLAA